MSENLQAGDISEIRRFYYDAIDNFTKKRMECLNVGSGIVLEFEKLVAQYRPDAAIDCLDLHLPALLPSYIRKFYKASVEEEIKLKEYDIVTCFEVLEHVDQTDVLLRNCWNNLKPNGLFMISVPNLASFYARIELAFGFQPHILEVSNVKANFGGGKFAHWNNPRNEPIHHIRGITYKALKELLEFNKFKIVKARGHDHRAKWLFRGTPSLAPAVFLTCRKIVK